MDLDSITVYNTQVDYTCDVAMQVQKDDENLTLYVIQSLLAFLKRR